MMEPLDLFIPFTEQTVQIFPEKEIFRVFLLSAPLSLLGKKLGLSLNPNWVTINAFHSGLGFQSTNIESGQKEFYIDFLAQQFGANVFLPDIITNPDGTKDLQWNNKAFVSLGPSIDRNYWNGSVYICNISGAQLNRYQQWILHSFIPQYPIYQFLRVSLEPLTREHLFSPLLDASICDTFCYASFAFFQQLKMCIDYVTDPYVTIVSALVSRESDIMKLNYENPVEKNAIIAYYEALESKLEADFSLKQKIHELELEIQRIEDPNERRLAQIRLHTDDRTVPILITQTVQDQFDYFLLYTYLPSTHSYQYFQITYSSFYINYIESDLKRTVQSINIFDQRVLDPYTLPNFYSTCPQGESSCHCCARSNTSVYLVVGLVLFFIFFLFFFLLLFYIS